MKPQEILDALHWRYSVKKFDSTKKIEESIWQNILDAAVLTPSSFGLQPWQFLDVRNVELREKLVLASYGQKQVAESSHLLVLTCKKTMDHAHLDRFLAVSQKIRKANAMAIIGENGATDYSAENFKAITLSFIQSLSAEQNFIWNANQIYIVLGNILTVAAMLGVDAIPMEGFEAEKYNEILHIDKNYTAKLVVPFGYRSAQDKNATYNKVRFDKSEIVKII
jgi:nitroreductase